MATQSTLLSRYLTACREQELEPIETDVGALTLCWGYSTIIEDHGESATTSYVFDPTSTDDEIELCLRVAGLMPRDRCNHSHDCCGCWIDGGLTIYPSYGGPRVAIIRSHKNV